MVQARRCLGLCLAQPTLRLVVGMEEPQAPSPLCPWRLQSPWDSAGDGLPGRLQDNPWAPLADGNCHFLIRGHILEMHGGRAPPPGGQGWEFLLTAEVLGPTQHL